MKIADRLCAGPPVRYLNRMYSAHQPSAVRLVVFLWWWLLVVFAFGCEVSEAR